MAETAGSLVDKISILELKIFHMKAQTHRTGVTAEHRAACRMKCKILNRQRDDLVQELSQFLMDLARGNATLKIYKQFKMYNDPSYRSSSSNSTEKR